ncbi:MAG: hypothetical protein WAT19_03390 [Ferruginibacter sp.]
MITVVLPLLLCCASVKNPESIQYKNIKSSAEGPHTDTILIAGRGEMPSRLFLDKLSDALSAQLKMKKVFCQYSYLGADAKELYAKLETLVQTTHCNVLLLINETNSPSVQTHSQDYQLGGGLRARENVLRYYQSFTIFAMLPSKCQDTLWESELQVSIDFRKDIYYETIAASIIKTMQESKMVF